MHFGALGILGYHFQVVERQVGDVANIGYVSFTDFSGVLDSVRVADFELANQIDFGVELHLLEYP